MLLRLLKTLTVVLPNILIGARHITVSRNSLFKILGMWKELEEIRSAIEKVVRLIYTNREEYWWKQVL